MGHYSTATDTMSIFTHVNIICDNPYALCLFLLGCNGNNLAWQSAGKYIKEPYIDRVQVSTARQ